MTIRQAATLTLGLLNIAITSKPLKRHSVWRPLTYRDGFAMNLVSPATVISQGFDSGH